MDAYSNNVGRSAEMTLANDRIDVHPQYNSDVDDRAPDIWQNSDTLRDLLRAKGDPDEGARRFLATAINRQLRTTILYWQVTAFYRYLKYRKYRSVLKHLEDVFFLPFLPLFTEAEEKGSDFKEMIVYGVLFPGEARDNTGIKDLNDKVLGYTLNGIYLGRRQQKIHEIFHRDKFMVVGQDYKTAFILTLLENSRKDFVKKLRELDKALRDVLLNEILPVAEQDAESKGENQRIRAIKKLDRTLREDEDYRFDIYFGHSTVLPQGSIANAVEVVFRLITESLKGAATARFISKGKSLKTRIARRFVKGFKADREPLDGRGKEFKTNVFLAALKKAVDIKEFMVDKPSERNGFSDYYHIYIDTVWTVAFLKYRRRFFGNSDVIRDVRKKKLVKPPGREGNIKWSLLVQKDLLELWLVVLNLLDFIKDFLTREFRQELQSYHEDALEVSREVRRPPGEEINWHKLEDVLTKDLRQDRPIAVLGTASEFLFYSTAADYPERIFFSMDIRDLGVDLVLLYENSNEEIEDKRPTGVALMEETFRATDPINERKRFTYDRVVYTFRHFYAILAKSASVKRTDGKSEAREAFGQGIRSSGKLPSFEESVQIMLGGDEVFVAAHPYFSAYVNEIIKTLDETPYETTTLNMRTAVAFSRAKVKSNPKDQREANQYAHYQAMKGADDAPTTLKLLERAQRRIERLIHKLEENEEKKDKAQPFHEELEKLGLTKLFARVNYGNPKVLSARDFGRFIRYLQMENVPLASKMLPTEFVDFDGNAIDEKALEKKAEALEEKVRKVVGRDNTHIDPPPVRKIPKIIDDFLNPKPR